MDLSALGRTPIREHDPCGPELGPDDPDYEIIEAEILKLDSPASSEPVDWARIQRAAESILHGKSKDLKVACRLAVALVSTRGVPGLDQGVEVLREMMEAFWDTLHPERPRRRKGAIEWWVKHTERKLEELKKIEEPRLSADQAGRLEANLEAIEALLAREMPDLSLSGLQTWVRDQQQEPLVASTNASRTSRDSDNGTKADPDPRVVLGDLSRVSRLLLHKDPKDPLAYRYLRMATWAWVTALPSHKDNETQIPAPQEQDKKRLEGLRDAGDPDALIYGGEELLSRYPFWLDLNRHAAEALDQLGPEYREAMDALRHETAGLLRRLPGLDTLCFWGKTPFADDETQSWLGEIGPFEAPAEGGASSDPTDASDSGAEEAAIEKTARDLAQKRKYAEAVSVLQEAMQRSPSRCGRMRWRLCIAQVLLKDKKGPHRALPHLEEVLADVDHFRLETWDPALAVEMLNEVRKGYQALDVPEYQARAEELLRRMARVDPAAALRAAP